MASLNFSHSFRWIIRALFNYTLGGLFILGFTAFLVHTVNRVGELRETEQILVMGFLGLPTASVLLKKSSIWPCNRSGNQCVSFKDLNWTIVASRAACFLWHLCIAYEIVFSIRPMYDLGNNLFVRKPNPDTLVAYGLYICHTSVLVEVYLRCWYEKAITEEDESIYGSTVFVSAPVFKTFGHFALIIRDHKYDMTLKAGTAVFKDRLLEPGEAYKIRNQSGNGWFVVGWTSRSHEEIKAVFKDVTETFGTYDVIDNNCRHFLQLGCRQILNSTTTMHKEFLDGKPGFVLFYMIWVSAYRDFYRWIWEIYYGQASIWEEKSTAHYLKGGNVYITVQRKRSHWYYYVTGWLLIVILVYESSHETRSQELGLFAEVVCIMFCMIMWRFNFFEAFASNSKLS